MPAPFEREPPVIEPPGFITWPSRVTILYLFLYLFEMPIAQSISSTTITLPRRFETTFLYCSSHSTRFDAISINPKLSSRFFSSIYLGLIAESGRKVALPWLFCLRKLIARFASLSLLVTIFCIAAPRATSTAVEYSLSTLIS